MAFSTTTYIVLVLTGTIVVALAVGFSRGDQLTGNVVAAPHAQLQGCADGDVNCDGVTNVLDLSRAAQAGDVRRGLD